MKWIERLFSCWEDPEGIFAPPQALEGAIPISSAYLCVQCRVILNSPKGYRCPRCNQQVRGLPYILRGLWRALEPREETPKSKRPGDCHPATSLNTTLYLTDIERVHLKV